jgi:hypothetical protein
MSRSFRGRFESRSWPSTHVCWTVLLVTLVLNSWSFSSNFVISSRHQQELRYQLVFLKIDPYQVRYILFFEIPHDTIH